MIARLRYRHAEVVAKAVECLQAVYAKAPDLGALLEEPFTLRDQPELHEAVAGMTVIWTPVWVAMVAPGFGSGYTSKL